MALILIFLLQLTLCVAERAHTFHFNIHRNIQNNIESYFKFKFESTSQLCYGSALSCTNFFITPNSLYSWISNTTYINRNKIKASGDPHSEDYGQCYLKNELVREVYSFKLRLQIDSLFISDANIYFSPQSKDPKIQSSIGLLRSMFKYKYVSFAEQLYLDSGVDKDTLTIQYIDKTKGRITFGELPRKPESLLHKIPIYDPTESPQFLTMVTELSFNKEKINSHFKVNIDESFGFIEFPDSFKYLIDIDYRHIFAKYFKEKTYVIPEENNNYWQNITYYVCDKAHKDIILPLLPEIQFKIDQSVLTLKRDNMLIDYEDNQMIFAIVFSIADLNLLKSVWILGEPFLKEFDIEHNFEEKKIKLYQREFDRSTPAISLHLFHYLLLIVSLGGLILQVVTSVSNNKMFYIE